MEKRPAREHIAAFAGRQPVAHRSNEIPGSPGAGSMKRAPDGSPETAREARSAAIRRMRGSAMRSIVLGSALALVASQALTPVRLAAADLRFETRAGDLVDPGVR